MPHSTQIGNVGNGKAPLRDLDYFVDFGLKYAWWTEGTNFQAKGYTNGQRVEDWPSEIHVNETSPLSLIQPDSTNPNGDERPIHNIKNGISYMQFSTGSGLPWMYTGRSGSAANFATALGYGSSPATFTIVHLGYDPGNVGAFNSGTVCEGDPTYDYNTDWWSTQGRILGSIVAQGIVPGADYGTGDDFDRHTPNHAMWATIYNSTNTGLYIPYYFGDANGEMEWKFLGPVQDINNGDIPVDVQAYLRRIMVGYSGNVEDPTSIYQYCGAFHPSGGYGCVGVLIFNTDIRGNATVSRELLRWMHEPANTGMWASADYGTTTSLKPRTWKQDAYFQSGTPNDTAAGTASTGTTYWGGTGTTAPNDREMDWTTYPTQKIVGQGTATTPGKCKWEIRCRIRENPGPYVDDEWPIYLFPRIHSDAGEEGIRWGPDSNWPPAFQGGSSWDEWEIVTTAELATHVGSWKTYSGESGTTSQCFLTPAQWGGGGFQRNAINFIVDGTGTDNTVLDIDYVKVWLTDVYFDTSSTWGSDDAWTVHVVN